MNATIFRKFYTKNKILNIFISKNKTADKKMHFVWVALKRRGNVTRCKGKKRVFATFARF